MIRLLSFFRAFRERVFGPPALPGWEGRYRTYKSGRTGWPSPTPGTPDIIPWPHHWLCITTDDLDEIDAARGFRFSSVECEVTGETMPPGTGVRCLRCGKSLSPKAANMITAVSPPYCTPCSRYVSRVIV